MDFSGLCAARREAASAIAFARHHREGERLAYSHSRNMGMPLERGRESRHRGLGELGRKMRRRKKSLARADREQRAPSRAVARRWSGQEPRRGAAPRLGHSWKQHSTALGQLVPGPVGEGRTPEFPFGRRRRIANGRHRVRLRGDRAGKNEGEALRRASASLGSNVQQRSGYWSRDQFGTTTKDSVSYSLSRLSVRPPSTVITCPVRYESGSSSSRTTLATSSGRPKRGITPRST